MVLALALAADLVFGDPRNVFHPVAWLGRLIALVMKAAPGRGRARQFAYGAAVVVAFVGLTAAAVSFGLSYLGRLGLPAYVVAGALLLKFSFALRGLGRASVKVRDLLDRDRLPEARLELRALVGRDTTTLEKPQAVSAVVESVAENSCDSFVAPLFYFLILGVPGAVAYRVINTFDAMIGHHGKWEYLGKFAARLDMAANFVPARISAMLIAAAAGLCRLDAGEAWRSMVRDRVRTESPNAGWTMGAAAGALGVRLEKVGFYALGNGTAALTTARINEALRLLAVQASVWSVACLGVLWLRQAFVP